MAKSIKTSSTQRLTNQNPAQKCQNPLKNLSNQHYSTRNNKKSTKIVKLELIKLELSTNSPDSVQTRFDSMVTHQ